MEQIEAQKEMMLGLEDVNKYLENEQDCLYKGLQEAMAQIGWLGAQVVIPREMIPREVLDDLLDDDSSDDNDEDGPGRGQDWMDEGSALEPDSSDSDQQLPISGGEEL